MPKLEPYSVLSTNNPSQITFKVTIQSTSQISMFDAPRQTSLMDLREKLKTIFSETCLDGLGLYWKDEEGDLINIKCEDDFRVAMKWTKQDIIVKFILDSEGAKENIGNIKLHKT